MSGLNGEDPMLFKLWPATCDDHMWTTAEATGADAREAFIRSFALEPPFQLKGKKYSTGRWFSILTGMRETNASYHTKLLALAVLSMRKGWSAHWDDLWCGGARLAAACSVELPAPGGEAADVHGALATAAAAKAKAKAKAGPGAAAKPKPAPKPTPAKAKTLIKGQLTSVAKSSANQLHVCARIMANPDLPRKSRMIILAAGPIETQLDMMSEMHSRPWTITSASHSLAACLR
jgi:hypothetical protein